MGRFGRAFRNIAGESRALTKQTFVEAGFDEYLFGTGKSKSGAEVNNLSALRMVAVYSCVNLLADTLAGFPLELVQELPGGARRKIATPEVLQAPAGRATLPFNFIHTGMVSVLLTGDTFIYVERDKEENPITLSIVHPDFVTTRLEPSGIKMHRVGARDLVSGWDMLHIPGFVMPNDLTGLSPIALAKEAIGLGLTVEEYGARFFENGAHMSGVIEAPGKFDIEGAKVMAQSLAKNHSGMNAHLPGVLTAGAQWKSITVPPDDAQFLETRRFQKSEVALLYRVPPYMIDPSVTSSWGTGITEQNRGLVTYTLTPWMLRFEQALSLLFPPGQVVKFNPDALLRGTTKERYETYGLGLTHGFMCADDVRELEDERPLPDGLGQKFYRQANLVEVGTPPALSPSANGDTNDGN